MQIPGTFHFYSRLLASSYSAPININKEQELFKIFHSAKNAKDRKASRDAIACANLRFVAKVVNKYQNKSVDMEDTFSEAIAAMISAIDTFDPTRGNKFITHAIWAIRAAIAKFLNQQESLVHIPANKILERRRVSRLLDAGKFVEAKAQDNAKCTFIKTVSIDAPAKIQNDFSKETLAACIKDTNFSTEIQMNEIYKKKICTELLATLSERERHILKSNCGFLGESQNYRMLESEMNVSRERVRQIKNAAIAKLRKRTEDMGINKHTFYLS